MVALPARRAWEAAAAVLDPEVPAVTVADLGILRAVDIGDFALLGRWLAVLWRVR